MKINPSSLTTNLDEISFFQKSNDEIAKEFEDINEDIMNKSERIRKVCREMRRDSHSIVYSIFSSILSIPENFFFLIDRIKYFAMNASPKTKGFCLSISILAIGIFATMMNSKSSRPPQSLMIEDCLKKV